MKKVNFESILKMLLSTTYVVGISGGLFISAMVNFESSKSVLFLTLQLFIIISVGTVIGSVSKKLKLKRLTNNTNIDEEDNLKISGQKAFFIALLVMAIAHFLNADMNEWNQFSAMLLTGGVFILGLVNGHIDISTYAAKYLLVLGLIPLLLSFVLGYSYNGDSMVVISVWIFGFMGLLSYLLILSNSQLNSQLFSSKHINISNRRKIKLFNFGIVLVFFILCLVVINFGRIIKVSGYAIKSLINSIYKILAWFTIWLLNNPTAGQAKETDIEINVSSYYFGKSVVFDISVLVIIIILLILTISFVVVMIKKHKISKAKKTPEEIDEFDEESSIIKERLHLNLGKKFTYNIKNLEEIQDVKEKTRYLYGFIIERLYYKKVNISKSDTPEEIIQKVFKFDNGKYLEELGFEDFTEKYRKVRYGGKKIQFDKNIGKMAKMYEQAIMNFNKQMNDEERN